MFKSLIGALTLGVVLFAQQTFSPARYRTGSTPALPAMAVGGGQVLLEVEVSSDGRVTAITPLRTTPPFTERVIDAVRDWQFVPAADVPPEPRRAGEPSQLHPVASKVLVAAVFRPPALNGPTLGEAARDTSSGSDDTPFPLNMTMPAYPASALNGGVVLLEARIDPTGAVADVAVIRSAPPFDDAAQKAARQWTFRPSRVRGVSVSTFVYIAFGFPVPIGTAPRGELVEAAGVSY